MSSNLSQTNKQGLKIAEERECYLCTGNYKGWSTLSSISWLDVPSSFQLKFKLFKEESNRPGEVICKLAEDESVDLVVIGSRGMGTLRRTFLGSVSDYCVHHNHCSIAVVPPPNRHDGHAHST